MENTINGNRAIAITVGGETKTFPASTTKSGEFSQKVNIEEKRGQQSYFIQNSRIGEFRVLQLGSRSLVTDVSVQKK